MKKIFVLPALCLMILGSFAKAEGSTGTLNVEGIVFSVWIPTPEVMPWSDMVYVYVQRPGGTYSQKKLIVPTDMVTITSKP